MILLVVSPAVATDQRTFSCPSRPSHTTVQSGAGRIVNLGGGVAKEAGSQSALRQGQVGSSLINPLVRLPR